MSSTSPSHWRADVYILSATLLASLGWIFSKEVLAGLSPLLFIGLRFLVAGFILLPFAWSALRALSSKDIQRLSSVGAMFALGMMLWIYGLAHSEHLGVGAFLNSLSVVLVPVVALAFGEKPNRMIWLSLPLALLGMALLFLENHVALGVGEIAYLLGAVVFAVYFNLNSQAAYRLPLLALTALQLIVVGVITLTVSALLETWNFQQPIALWGWLALSILISTCGRFILQTKAQGLAPASHVGLIMSLEPVWVALLAAAWFGESMSAVQILGCCLIFGAVLLSRWRSFWSLLYSWRSRNAAPPSPH
ncbi:DMT family transporter [Thiolinea disciformis]|uniref:DMT family transporter n=1 Tax=Thiolinea disciformis TaxID=125614 RepID=UPI00035DB413|nr:DMT family transporter [Thiolinea disciformis]